MMKDIWKNKCISFFPDLNVEAGGFYFRIYSTSSCEWRIVCGKNYDLGLRLVELIWLELGLMSGLALG